MNGNRTIPLSLYIHIPWCVRKCPYCDFNSHRVQETLPEKAYVQRLLDDLTEETKYIDDRPIHSIFIGGGTPSLFSPESIAALLQGCRERIAFTPQIEITLEANPGTVDLARFQGFREAGVNRLSIGIQSLADEKLKALGRIHDQNIAERAIEAAIAAKFDTFNLDLMHGLPNQTPIEALSDLKKILAYNPPHVSWYQLTLEPNTLFYHRPPALPNDDAIAEIQRAGQQLLRDAGYEQYEVSAYAKPDHSCRHNLNYWEFGDYLGIGAGAHGKITDQKNKTVQRRWKTKHPKEYLNPETAFIAGQTDVSPNALIFEFMLNRLRLPKPVSFDLFQSRTGLSPHLLFTTFNLAKEKELMEYNEQGFSTTPLGWQFLNDVIELFISCEQS